MRPKYQVFAMKFADVYPLYIQKAERKNRTKKEVDQAICWLTGYDKAGLQRQIKQGNDFETFFAQAPAINPNCSLIKGVVCGVRVEDDLGLPEDLPGGRLPDRVGGQVSSRQQSTGIIRYAP